MINSNEFLRISRKSGKNQKKLEFNVFDFIYNLILLQTLIERIDKFRSTDNWIINTKTSDKRLLFGNKTKQTIILLYFDIKHRINAYLNLRPAEQRLYTWGLGFFSNIMLMSLM